jgi:hypothetical protein
MSSTFDRIHVLTKEAVENLSFATPEQLQALIEERERLIQDMERQTPGAFSVEANRRKIEELEAWDQILYAKIEQMQAEIKVQLGAMKKFKKFMPAYKSPYSPGSIFFDKKN